MQTTSHLPEGRHKPHNIYSLNLNFDHLYHIGNANKYESYVKNLKCDTIFPEKKPSLRGNLKAGCPLMSKSDFLSFHKGVTVKNK